jgi:hypothetical protein
MKKLVAVLLFGIAMLVISCGQSARENEEKRIADSIRVADSIAMVQAEQQRIADSIALAIAASAHADSVAQGLIQE